MKRSRSVITILAAITATLLGAQSLFAAVIVDSITGRAEIQRAGQFNWEPVAPRLEMRNNDMLRVLDQSRVILRWDENNVFVNANSQIRINILDDERTNIISRHVTVFFGALFFVINKSIHRDTPNSSDVKVYTPTAIVAIRGTVFTVDVDKANGRTGVNVLQGTVLVRNIIRNMSIFLAAGYRTVIETNSDPTTPKSVSTEELAMYKTWIPAPLLEESLKKKPVVQNAAKDTLRTAVTVLALENRSGYKGTWEIGKIISETIATRLKGISGLPPVTVELSRSDDPLATGVQTKNRYIIQGTITEFDISQHAKVTATLDNYSEYSEARVSITLQLIDVAEKRLIFEDTFTGSFEDANLRVNSWQELRKLPFDLKTAPIGGTALGKAVGVVLTNATETLGGYLKTK